MDGRGRRRGLRSGARISAVVLLAIAGSALAAPAGAAAATITVNSTGDTVADDGQCTLREAIGNANNDSASFTTAGECATGSGADVIGFSLPNPSTITLTSVLPDVFSDLQIQGPGATALNVHRSSAMATPAFRILHIRTTVTSSISGLTVSNGLDDGTGINCCAGGILNDGTLTLMGVAVSGNTATYTGSGNPTGGGVSNLGTLNIDQSVVSGNAVQSNTPGVNAEGGGIYSCCAANNGTLSIDRSVISGNTATASGAGSGASVAKGGGIRNEGTLTVDRSTVSGNASDASGGTTLASGTGGGIDSEGSSVVTVRRSTLSGNSAGASGDPAENDASGGGLFLLNSTSQSIDRATISGNSLTASGTAASADGGGIFAALGAASVTSSTVTANSSASAANAQGGTLTFKNSIVSSPLGGGASCSSTTSQGYNIDGGTTCHFTQLTDHQSTDPQLDPAGLAANGGLTQTIALLASSPAIDAGVSSAGETTDERELPRPFDFTGISNVGDGSDIGAFELQGACLGQTAPGGTCPSTSSAPTGLRAAALKKCKKKHSKKKRRKCRRKALRLPV